VLDIAAGAGVEVAKVAWGSEQCSGLNNRVQGKMNQEAGMIEEIYWGLRKAGTEFYTKVAKERKGWKMTL
jgi:hypothetical protein